MDGFASQLPYKCHLEAVASVGDWLKICPQLDSRVVGDREDAGVEAGSEPLLAAQALAKRSKCCTSCRAIYCTVCTESRRQRCAGFRHGGANKDALQGYLAHKKTHHPRTLP